MRLLFDENLSPSLVTRLATEFPESMHVRDTGLRGHPDQVIWAYAGEHGLIIVSKDDDFHHFSFLYGPPPKAIGVRLGNCTTTEVETLLRSRSKDIHHFVADAESGFLALP